MIAAVVFDLDGVLIDSEPVWEEVRRGLVAERGGRWAPDALAAASLVLPGLAELTPDASRPWPEERRPDMLCS